MFMCVVVLKTAVLAAYYSLHALLSRILPCEIAA